MTNFEKIRSMSVEDLAKFLNSYDSPEDSHWEKWWGENYCRKCEAVTTFVPYLNREAACAYCEVNRSCRFFPEKEDVPSSEETIKMWLESNVEGK